MNFLNLLFIGLMLVSCGSTKELSDNEESMVVDEVAPSNSQENVNIKAILGDFKDSDAYEIKSVSIQGNTMFMEITYIGGCGIHQFELIGQSIILKTLPPKRSIALIHKNGDDSCHSIVTKILEIDIKDLAFNQTPNAEIILMLKGWKSDINYRFKI